MRTALSQFGWWDTPADAAAYLATAARTADNHGDRVAAERRAQSLPGYELPTLPDVDELRRMIARWSESKTIPFPRGGRAASGARR